MGNEITGATDACMSGTIEAVDWATDPEHLHDWKILGNYLHDNGNTKLEHGIYLGGYGTNSDFEIAWNRISQQTGGRGIQLYGHEASDYIQHISIHDNEISEVDRDGIVLGDTDADILYLSDIHIFWRTGRCTGWAGCGCEVALGATRRRTRPAWVLTVLAVISAMRRVRRPGRHS